MPHRHRFYISASPAPGDDAAVLTGPEAHHALHVVRLRVGDGVELFDGAGREWDARVAGTTRHEVRVQLGECREGVQPIARLTLFQAWIHRDKAVDELVRHGTEIGIDRFVFFPSHRSERKPRVNEKWLRTAIETCKQCRRAWLPGFAVANSLEDAFAQATGTLVVATRELPAIPIAEAIVSQDVSLFVGPEGDFTEQELGSFIARGAKAISLGGSTFRSEVAAVLASTLIQYKLGNLGPL